MWEYPSCIEELHLKTKFEIWETQACPAPQIKGKGLAVWKPGDLVGADRREDAVMYKALTFCVSDFFGGLLISDYNFTLNHFLCYG